MTWAYKHRPEMIEGLAQAYQSIGRRLGARVAPVGHFEVFSRMHR